MPQPVRRRLDAIDRSGFERAAPEPTERPRRRLDSALAGLDLEPESTFDPVATGLRVLPGVGGSFFGPIGGAIGSGAGELAAQLYEGRSLNPFADDGLNLAQVGVQAGLGAIPGAKAFRDLKGFTGMLARTGVHTGVGAALGGVTAPLVEEVEREGLEGLNVFDLEDGVGEKMAQGAKWGAGFGAAGGVGMEGLSKYLSSRAAQRAGTIDDQFDPAFDARYKEPVAAPPRRQPPLAAAPDMSAGIPPMTPLPAPGEVPPIMPAPFSAPPPVPDAPMPLMPRPNRAYDLLDDELMGAADVPPPAPNLPPEIVSVLQEYGVEDALIRSLTADDAVAVVSRLDAERAIAGLEPDEVAMFEKARELDPSADPMQLRQELDQALELFYDQKNLQSEGLGPRELMQALAERGGLNEADDFAGDQWNRERRPNAEMQRIKDLVSNAGYMNSGRFGTAFDVPGVFPRKGKGLTFDEMVADLRDDPRFADVQTPNDLIALLEQAAVTDRAQGFGGKVKPTFEDLKMPRSMRALDQAAAGVDEPNPLDDILRIFDEAERPATVNTLEDLQRQWVADRPRPGQPGDVPDTEVARRLEAERNLPPDADLEALIARETVPVQPLVEGETAVDVRGRLKADFRARETAPIDPLEAERVRTQGADPLDAALAPRETKVPQDVMLPGAEDVRALENATPEVADVPFSLEPPAKGQAIEQRARGAKEADAQSSLLDDLMRERGAITPGATMPLAGAAAGGATGAASIDEDDTFGEKVAKVGGGIVAGAAVGAGVGAGAARAARAATPGGPRESTPAPTRTAGAPAAARPTTETITPARGRPQTLPKYAGNINLERLNTPDAVKQTINEIADNLGPQLDSARRGRIAQDVTRQMAAELGMTEAELLSRRRGQAFNAEQALAAREINAASARRLTEAAAAVRENPTPENYARFMSSLQQQVAIQEQIAGATAEAGRSLAQFRMMAGDTLSLPELNELVLSAGGPETMDALARRIQELDPTNLRAMNQFAREAKKATVVDKVYEAWMNALLSGPVTHVANTVSNGLTATTHPLEKTVTGLLDLLRAKASGTPQERFAREGAYAVVGLWKGLSGGVRAGLQAALTDMPAFGLARPDAATPGGKIGGPVGHAVRLPTKALMFEDEFFKNIIYSADLHARAVRTALREGLSGRAVGTRVADILQNPSVEMRQSGQNEALYRTFNSPLTARWEKSLMNLRSSVPGARWIMPFLRTPINVAKFGLERTPLHLADVLAKVAKGDINLQDLEEESAKIAIGATLAFGVAAAYKNGLITGGGSPDRSKHATQAVTRPDYSVKVGDQWYSFQRLEPAGISLGLVADFMETLETGKQDVTQLPAKLLYSFSRNLQSKTFLQGLTDFFNVLSDYPRYGDEWINRMGGSLIPTAVAQLSRAADPVARKPRSVKEAIVNRAGGGESLTPMIDVFGKPITSDMGFVERLVSPVQRRKAVDDPLIEELNRLGITLSVPSERLTVKDRDLSTNDKSTLAQARGQAVKAELDDLFGSASFQRADDDARRERIERAINQARDAVSRKARARVRREVPLTLESLLGVP